jgi:hypothetical protein
LLGLGVERCVWPDTASINGTVAHFVDRPTKSKMPLMCDKSACWYSSAMLVRTSFLEGKARWYKLFEPHPPDIIAQFCERVPMLQGKLDERASTATSYCWLIWSRCYPPFRNFRWIPPSQAPGKARQLKDQCYGR